MLMKSMQPWCGQVELQRLLIGLSPPFVSAKSWAIADGRTGRLLFGKAESDKREIASLTKIMTAHLVMRLVSTLHVDLNRTYTTTSEAAGAITGTRAMLDEGDRLCLMDLLYGLLLPSGNDAAIVLAEFFGSLLLKLRLKTANGGKTSAPGTAIMSATAEGVFVEEMNRVAKELKLVNTNFLNPHGMHSYCNRSSAADIARLSSIAMNDPLFREIVRKKQYACKARNAEGEEKEFVWDNTNKLLGKNGCNGIKTGITETAGPCLVTSIQTKSLFYIIVLLNSKTMDARWQEIKKLRAWATERLKQIDRIAKHGKSSKRKILRTFKHI